jgi:hypothetical protein
MCNVVREVILRMSVLSDYWGLVWVCSFQSVFLERMFPDEFRWFGAARMQKQIPQIYWQAFRGHELPVESSA